MQALAVGCLAGHGQAVLETHPQQAAPGKAPPRSRPRPAARAPVPPSAGSAMVPAVVLPSRPKGLRGADTVQGLVWLSSTQPSPSSGRCCTLPCPHPAFCPQGLFLGWGPTVWTFLAGRPQDGRDSNQACRPNSETYRRRGKAAAHVFQKGDLAGIDKRQWPCGRSPHKASLGAIPSPPTIHPIQGPSDPPASSQRAPTQTGPHPPAHAPPALLGQPV